MRVIVAEDEKLYRKILISILSSNGLDVVGEAASADEVLALVHQTPPDIVLLDIKMPPHDLDDGLQAALCIRTHYPQVGIIILSKYGETEYAIQLLQACSDRVGYLLKDSAIGVEELIETIKRVGNGGADSIVVDPNVVKRLVNRPRVDDPLQQLTDRERHTLELMAEGRSNPAIAKRLYVSRTTVERYASAIFAKLGLNPHDGERTADDNARVLAVLTYLRRTGQLPSR
jgi:DNA-binding NarL/FixJ family response regulator